MHRSSVMLGLVLVLVLMLWLVLVYVLVLVLVLVLMLMLLMRPHLVLHRWRRSVCSLRLWRGVWGQLSSHGCVRQPYTHGGASIQRCCRDGQMLHVSPTTHTCTTHTCTTDTL